MWEENLSRKRLNNTEEDMNKKSFAGFLAGAAYLMFSVTFVFAEDLNKYYNIVPHDFAENLHYSRKQPPFQINAPKGWYMALANSAEAADRAIFFKTDPRKVFSEGHIQTPNIRVSFAPNPQALPAAAMTSDYASQIRSAGGNILLGPQSIIAGGALGSHFTSLDPNSNIVMDTYVFQQGGTYICVMAVCKYAEFNEIKAGIKEVVDSIKF
jgi:hypothetical protein